MGELGQISSAHTTPKMWRWHFRVKGADAGASLEARLAGSCAVPVGGPDHHSRHARISIECDTTVWLDMATLVWTRG
jgi:hypothetical protein